jgi:hypothetical protein
MAGGCQRRFMQEDGLVMKTVELEARRTAWEIRSGQTVDAYGYNGQVPGPVIEADDEPITDRERILVLDDLKLDRHG